MVERAKNSNPDAALVCNLIDIDLIEKISKALPKDIDFIRFICLVAALGNAIEFFASSGHFAVDLSGNAVELGQHFDHLIRYFLFYSKKTLHVARQIAEYKGKVPNNEKSKALANEILKQDYGLVDIPLSGANIFWSKDRVKNLTVLFASNTKHCCYFPSKISFAHHDFFCFTPLLTNLLHIK